MGQDIGLSVLLPLAVEVLRDNPLAPGGMYEGDLLRAVLTSNPAVWRLTRSVRQDHRTNLGCSRADPGTRPSPPICHHSPYIASDARISHQMRLGGVFAVQSLDGVSPRTLGAATATVLPRPMSLMGSFPRGPGLTSRPGIAYSHPMQLASVGTAVQRLTLSR
ncbi:contact-dependent growth inhibition system immunity protein [Streptomyces sp. NPDC057546]|uniref:contact-dependent growth inhibition system immunity protein n=1 Tax=Streptomyces sp. NPDC057546 TaxID=3346165 RepID=UPI0036B20BC1